MTKGRTLTVIVRGDPASDDRVRLQDFLAQLTALRAALKHTQRVMGGGEEWAVDYQIVALSYNSPARVDLEEIPTKGTKAKSTPLFVAKSFISNLRQIEKGNIPPSLDHQAVEAYKDFTEVDKRGLATLGISIDGDKPVNVDRRLEAKLNAAIGLDECVIGSVTGRLEAISLHGSLVFAVYPVIGQKISCRFGPEMKPRVIAAIDHRVQVTGTLRYKKRNQFPHEVETRDLRILDNAEKARLSDLRGMAPEATGDVSSADFIRAMRDDW